MKFLLLLLIPGLLSFPALALTPLEAEEKYALYSEGLASGETSGFFNGTELADDGQKVLVDSLWDFVAEPENKPKLDSSLKLWKSIDFKSMPLPEQVRLFLLGLRLGGPESRLDSMKAVLVKKLKGKLNRRTSIIVFNHSETLRREGLGESVDDIEARVPKLKHEYDVISSSGRERLTKKELREIFSSNIRSPGKSFVFIACRSNRDYPCRVIIKDKKGEVVKTPAGEKWSLPVLAKSRFGLPFNLENGDTPSGFFQIESVMPWPRPVKEYGRNRRLIINVAEKALASKVLPASQQRRSWWRQVFIATELGRSDLRIHGTGMVNVDSQSMHPSFVASHGCIKLREGTYGGVMYNDQKLLLDELMRAQGLKGTRTNEFLIKANLLLFNIPGEGAVNFEDIQEYLEE